MCRTKENRKTTETFKKFPHFNKEMRESLIYGKELSCAHIDLAQKIISAQFPRIHGLQSPLNLSAISASHEIFLQIHFLDCDNSWITSSFREEVLTIYNSYIDGPITILEDELALVYKSLISKNDDSLHSPVIIWFDLKQIATQMLSTVSGTEKCAL